MRRTEPLNVAVHLTSNSTDSNEGDPSARLVDLPDVESLVLIQALVKLVWRVALGQNTLTSFSKLDCIWVGHFTDDAVYGIDGPRSSEKQQELDHNNHVTVTCFLEATCWSHCVLTLLFARRRKVTALTSPSISRLR